MKKKMTEEMKKKMTEEMKKKMTEKMTKKINTNFEGIKKISQELKVKQINLYNFDAGDSDDTEFKKVDLIDITINGDSFKLEDSILYGINKEKKQIKLVFTSNNDIFLSIDKGTSGTKTPPTKKTVKKKTVKYIHGINILDYPKISVQQILIQFQKVLMESKKKEFRFKIIFSDLPPYSNRLLKVSNAQKIAANDIFTSKPELSHTYKWMPTWDYIMPDKENVKIFVQDVLESFGKEHMFIVHCAGGTGRSGLYVLITKIIDLVKNGGNSEMLNKLLDFDLDTIKEFIKYTYEDSSYEISSGINIVPLQYFMSSLKEILTDLKLIN